MSFTLSYERFTSLSRPRNPSSGSGQSSDWRPSTIIPGPAPAPSILTSPTPALLHISITGNFNRFIDAFLNYKLPTTDSQLTSSTSHFSLAPPPLTPIIPALTPPPSANSFRYHSYAKTGRVAPQLRLTNSIPIRNSAARPLPFTLLTFDFRPINSSPTPPKSACGSQKKTNTLTGMGELTTMPTAQKTKSPKVLVIDVGGTHVKLLATGETVPIKIPSGPTMTANKMVSSVKQSVKDWKFDCISLGYPGPIINGHPLREPHNLGGGWMRFDFSKAFGCPVKVINDAAMQALGSYKGGRMLFLGLGTGLGSAMIVNGVLEPMELAHLIYKKGKTYEDYLGLRGLERMGKKKWRRYVAEIVETLKSALEADYVVLGGGNSKKLKEIPAGAKLGNNEHAFEGGFRMWAKENAQQ